MFLKLSIFILIIAFIFLQVESQMRKTNSGGFSGSLKSNTRKKTSTADSTPNRKSRADTNKKSNTDNTSIKQKKSQNSDPTVKKARGQSNYDKNMKQDKAQIKKRARKQYMKVGIGINFLSMDYIPSDKFSKYANSKQYSMFQNGQYYDSDWSYSNEQYLDQQDMLEEKRQQKTHKFANKQQENWFFLYTFGTAVLICSAFFILCLCKKTDQSQLNRVFLVDAKRKRKNF